MFLLQPTMAAELKEVVVEEDGGRYYLRSEVVFNADQQSLYSVLTNFDLFVKFTSAIVESYNMEPDENGRPQFHARLEGCVLFFCRSYIREGYVETTAVSEITAFADPERSDFKFGKERWTLKVDEKGTRMVYEFEMEPDFWVPPLIGPYYIKRAMKSGGEQAINRIEVIAQAQMSETGPDTEKVVQSTSEH